MQTINSKDEPPNCYPAIGRLLFLSHPSQIPTVPTLIVVTMYNYHPRLLAKSNIEKQYFSHRVNDVCNGSPSRIRRVRRISFGMTILPKSSTRRTMPVAFIFLSSPCGGFPVVVFAEKGEVCMKRVFWRILFGAVWFILAGQENRLRK